MKDLKPLKLAALAATPGPWEVDTIRSDGEYGSDDDGGYGFDTYQVTTDTGACVVDCLNNDIGAVHVEGDGRAWDKVAKQDAQYIAAASPDVVLALVAEVEQLRAALAEQDSYIETLHAERIETPPAAPAGLSNADEVIRMSDQSVRIRFASSRSASEFERTARALLPAANKEK